MEGGAGIGQHAAAGGFPAALALQTAMQRAGQGFNALAHAGGQSLQQAGQQLQSWTGQLGRDMEARRRGFAVHLSAMQHPGMGIRLSLPNHKPPTFNPHAGSAAHPPPTQPEPHNQNEDSIAHRPLFMRGGMQLLAEAQQQQQALPFASITSPPQLGAAHATQALEPSAARKAELGRATWTLLHMLAAQYPERPTRQQKRDVTQLIDCLTRVYPCASCASHFQKFVRRDPPTVGSGRELQAWMCRIHNVVNRALNKPEFNCDVVAARWAPLECGPDGDAAGATGPSGCDMTVGRRR